MNILKRTLAIFFFCLIFLSLQAQEGTIQWTKNFGGNASDIANDFITTSDNALLIVGHTLSNNQDISNNNGGADVWVLKTDLDGTIQWSKTFGTTANEMAHGIAKTSNDEYIIAGTTHASGNGKGDAYLLKIDIDGNVIWEKTFGGEKFDGFQKIRATANQSFLVAGTTNSSENAPNQASGQGDIWILNIDADGNIIWEKTFGGSRSDLLEDLTIDSAGDIYLTGSTFSKDGNFQSNTTFMNDGFVLKLDADGNLLWGQQYGTDTPDGFNAITTTSNGTIAMLGYEGIQNTTVSGIQGKYEQDIWLQQINANGQVQLSQNLGGSAIDDGDAIGTTTDGGLLVAGTSLSFDGDISSPKGKKDIWVAKLDASGNMTWRHNIGGTAQDEARAVLQTADGNYFVLGTTYSDNGNLNNNKGSEDIVLTKIEGEFVFAVSLGADQSICQGESVTIIPFPNSCDDCSFVWSDGSNNASITVAPSQNASYAVTVTTADGFSASDAIGINVNPLPTVSVQTTNVACGTSNSGAIVLTPETGLQPFTYTWNNGASGNSLQNLEVGNYLVTISDSAGCSSLDNIIVQGFSAPNLSFQTQNIDCFGASTGSINSVPQGGTAPYTYLWSNGSTGTNINNLTAGTYTLTLTDANNCTAVETAVISQSNNILLSFDVQNVACNGQPTGTINTTITNGNAPYNFAWSNGSNNQNPNNLAAGIYMLTLTDDTGCTVSQAVEITESSDIQLSFNVDQIACFGFSTGQINSQIQGGNFPYTFAWSNGSNAPNLYDLGSGTYTLTITDANNCTAIQTTTLEEPIAIDVQLQGQNLSCFGTSDGIVSSIVQGGTPPFAYAWSNGQTTSSLENLGIGNYSLTVTDTNNCSITSTTQINAPEQLQITFETQDINCSGQSTGSISTMIDGGTPPYTYNWNNNTNQSFIDNLAAGSYELTLTDANACTAVQAIAIEQATPFDVDFSTTAVNCFGASTGQIVPTVNGGNPPYTYQWSTGATSATLDSLAAGNYELTLSDMNDCNTSFFVELEEATAINIDIATQNIDCHSNANGVLNSSASGGSPPYIYEWSNGSNAPTIENLGLGVYTLTVTDNNDCSQMTSQSIVEPFPLRTEIEIDPIACFGDSTANIYLTVFGGTSDYTIAWSTGNSQYSLNDLPAGEYALSVLDANNCPHDTIFQIIQPDNITTTIDIFHPQNNEANGAVAIDVQGGTSPYNITWSNGLVGTDIENLAADVYSYTIMDANNCILMDSVVLENMVATQNVSSKKWLEVYPNPTAEKLFFKATQAVLQDAFIQIFNTLGQVVLTKKQSLNQELLLGNLPTGTYYVSVHQGEWRWIEKIVVLK